MFERLGSLRLADTSRAEFDGNVAAADIEQLPISVGEMGRQVTMPLPEWRSALFLIRVFVAPLASVAADDSRRARIVESLRSMSDDVVKYKGLAAAREAVLREWGGE